MTNPPYHSWANYLTVKPFSILIALLFISSCATYKEQSNIHSDLTVENTNDITHTFYIAGGLGNASSVPNNALLQRFKEELDLATENSTLVFTGDNISSETNNWLIDSLFIQQQLDLSSNFK